MAWKIGRRRPDPEIGVTGPARVDSRTKRLTKRLEPGDIAIIDHEDLDLISAEGLVELRPLAVINAAASTSGRYPNLGPGVILERGIPLIDDAGSAVMDIDEGSRITIDGGKIYRGSTLIAEGIELTREAHEADLAEAQTGMTAQLTAFAHNTMEYVEREHEFLFDRVGVPDVKTNFEGRQVLIVIRGYHYKEDLQSLRSYIRDLRPLLVGVDGGADALLEQGHTPDVIVGDMDSVSDEALTCGAEIVVHAYRDGRAPGRKRVEDLGIESVIYPSAGTSEDIAMLLADAKGAKLILAVGTHSTLIEFLDKGRAGMASTFLTRLKVGSKLIDAKGASQLYQSRISTWQLLVLLLVGLIALGAAVASTAAGQAAWGLFLAWLNDVSQWFTNLFR